MSSFQKRVQPGGCVVESGHGSVWLPWRQTRVLGSQGQGRECTEAGVPSHGRGLLFNLNYHWGKLCMDTEAQRGRLTWPRSRSRLCQELRPPNFNRPLRPSDFPDGLWTEAGHITLVLVAGRIRPQSSPKTNSSIQGAVGGATRWATLGNHPGSFKKILILRSCSQKFQFH